MISTMTGRVRKRFSEFDAVGLFRISKKQTPVIYRYIKELFDFRCGDRPNRYWDERNPIEVFTAKNLVCEFFTAFHKRAVFLIRYIIVVEKKITIWKNGDNIMYGQRIRKLRKEKNWTLEEMAGKIGISRSTLAGYEKGYRNPPIPILIRISKLFNVSVDYILGLTDDKNIRRLEYDLSLYLKKENIKWKGVPLSEKELTPIREILDMLTQKSQDPI